MCMALQWMGTTQLCRWHAARRTKQNQLWPRATRVANLRDDLRRLGLLEHVRTGSSPLKHRHTAVVDGSATTTTGRGYKCDNGAVQHPHPSSTSFPRPHQVQLHAQVEDEGVALVQRRHVHRHLLRSRVALALDVQQRRLVHVTLDVVEAAGDTALQVLHAARGAEVRRKKRLQCSTTGGDAVIAMRVATGVDNDNRPSCSQPSSQEKNT